jgi:hypothetical protein
VIDRKEKLAPCHDWTVPLCLSSDEKVSHRGHHKGGYRSDARLPLSIADQQGSCPL